MFSCAWQEHLLVIRMATQSSSAGLESLLAWQVLLQMASLRKYRQLAQFQMLHTAWRAGLPHSLR